MQNFNAHSSLGLEILSSCMSSRLPRQTNWVWTHSYILCSPFAMWIRFLLSSRNCIILACFLQPPYLDTFHIKLVLALPLNFPILEVKALADSPFASKAWCWGVKRTWSLFTWEIKNNNSDDLLRYWILSPSKFWCISCENDDNYFCWAIVLF